MSNAFLLFWNCSTRYAANMYILYAVRQFEICNNFVDIIIRKNRLVCSTIPQTQHIEAFSCFILQTFFFIRSNLPSFFSEGQSHDNKTISEVPQHQWFLKSSLSLWNKTVYCPITLHGQEDANYCLRNMWRVYVKISLSNQYISWDSSTFFIKFH